MMSMMNDDHDFWHSGPGQLHSVDNQYEDDDDDNDEDVDDEEDEDVDDEEDGNDDDISTQSASHSQ